MMRSLQTALVIIVFCSACSGAEKTEKKPAGPSKWVLAQCAEDGKRVCKPSCSDAGKYGICFRDQKSTDSKADPNLTCYAFHAGKSCQPCEELYAINRAGVLKDANCEEFYTHIEAQNRKCGDCLIKQSWF